MSSSRTSVSVLLTSAALGAAITALGATPSPPAALASPPDGFLSSAAVPHSADLATKWRSDETHQRSGGVSPCFVAITDTLATAACAPTQVTVTLGVSCPLRLPLNVVLVVGRHLAMEDHLNDVKAAARDVIDRLNFEDGTKVGVISLSTQERVEQDLTDRKTTALAAVNRIQLDSLSPFNNYYDWIGQAERMLTEAKGDGDPAIPVIVLYSTGCPTGFDQYCQRQVGSANRAQGAGITMMTVCNPNARPFGFPLPGNHCRWLQQMASTGFHHDLSQAARISDDIEGVWDEGRSTTIDELVLTELLTAPLELLTGSAAPPPEQVPGGAVFRWQNLAPGTVVTATYAVSAPGGTNVTLRSPGSGAELTDSRSSSSEPVSLPPRALVVPECVAPTATPTPTQPPPTPAPTDTPTPTATTASRPGRVYLPVLLRSHCRPTDRHADVVLAIDTSSSMAEPGGDTTKIEAAKSAARAFVEATRPGADQVAIVAFDETAEIVAPLGSSQAELVAAIDRLTTDPGTRIDRALEASAHVLAGPGRRPRNHAVLILLSDGHTDGDRQAVLDAARALHRQDVTVYAVGLGPDVDRPLMEEVASSPPLYRAAQDAGALVRIYSEIVRELPCAADLVGQPSTLSQPPTFNQPPAFNHLPALNQPSTLSQPPDLDQPAAYDGAAGGVVGALGLIGGELYAGIGPRLVRYTQLEHHELIQSATTPVLDAVVRDIAVRPGRVLLATEGGLHDVVDHGPVLEPGTRISTFGQAVAVQEAFAHAYVALGPMASGGVMVFDVSGPSPLPSGSFMDNWSVTDLAVSGQLLFASTGSALVVASLARPDRPAEIGSFEDMPGAGPLAADPESGRIYAAGFDGVWVVDPTVPAVRGFVELRGTTALAARGDLLLAATSEAAVVTVDVSAPDAPRVTGSIPIELPARALVLDEGVAYAGHALGVSALNVAASTSSVASRSYTPSDVVAGRAAPGGGLPIYAATNHGLVVLEAPRSLGAPPSEVGVVPGPPALRVDAAGDLIGLLTESSVSLLDGRADRFDPLQLGETPFQAGRDVAVAGDSLVAAWSGGLEVFRYSVPGTLASVGEAVGEWELVRIVAADDGRHVFALDRGFGVRTFSLADPSSPRLTGGLQLPVAEWGTALALDGDRLYVSAGGQPASALSYPERRTNANERTTHLGTSHRVTDNRRRRASPRGIGTDLGVGGFSFASGRRALSLDRVAASAPPAPPALERIVSIDVTDPENPVVLDAGSPIGWPSAASASDGWIAVASSLGQAMPYPRRLVMFGGAPEISLPLAWHVTGAAMAYPQVILAAGDAGLLAAHVPHTSGVLATPTPWASATIEPGPTVSPTTAAESWRIVLPAAEAGS